MLGGGLGFILSALACCVYATTQEQWTDLYQDLSECTSMTGFCSKTHTETFQAFVHQGHGKEEECIAAGGVWHTLFQSVEQFAANSTQFEDTFDDQTPHLYIIRVHDHLRASKAARLSWASTHNLSPAHHHRHVRCNNHHYLLVDILPSAARAQGLHSIASIVAAVPWQAKISSSAWLALKTSPAQSTVSLMSTLTRAALTESLVQAWKAQFPDLASSLVVDHADLLTWALPASVLPTMLEFIARQGVVEWVEPKLDVRLRNENSQYATQSGVLDQRPLWDKGIRGQGQVVGVGDSGLDYNHCFFRDSSNVVSVQTGQVYNNNNNRKVVQYYAFADNGELEVAGHGTHVSGSVAGKDLSNTNSGFNGMAPEAKIAFFDIGIAGQASLDVPSSLERTMFPPSYQAGARIHTNSWGASSNTYDSMPRDIDRYTFTNQDYLVLVAAGNDGRSGSGTIGTPATAKNCITVGASQNTDKSYQQLQRSCTRAPCSENVADFSSRGPRFDGAIAPDIVAPGQLVVSAQSAASGTSCSLVAFQGTSMATPVTAGNAALVRQYFADGWYPSGTKTSGNKFTPMGALVKAVLVNSARLLTGRVGTAQLDSSKPGQIQGFGAIQLNNTLYFDNMSIRDLYVVGDFQNMKTLDDQEAPHAYNFTMTSPLTDLKVTLVWADASGTIGSRSVLVNDLDLTIKCVSGCPASAPTSKTFFPNGLTAADRTNNVEHITIPASSLAVDATFVATVSANSVPQGPQPYAFVVTGTFKATKELYPNGKSGNTGGGSAITWGGALLIAAACAAGVYLVVGLVIGKTRHQRFGLPPSHVAFWRGVPGLVKDGVVFVGSGVVSLGKRVTGKGASNTNTNANYRDAPQRSVLVTTSAAAATTTTPARAQPGYTPPKPVFSSSSSSAAKPKAAPPPPKSAAKTKWTVHLDPVSGNRYWFNPATGESTWTNPE